MDGGLAIVALGGNAIAPAGTAGTADEQRRNIARAMPDVADLVAEGWRVVLVHGNGPQVGNLLTKNELARNVVPPMPLDWCVAQTQATIGHTIANTLRPELARRGADRLVVPVTSRVRVAADDPAFDHPSKPIGRWVTDEEEVRRREGEGQRFTSDPTRGWRRVVASPEPLESLDRDAVTVLLEAGAVVVANGGGGIPTVAEADGALRGAEAVIDKDLAGGLLAAEIGAHVYVVLTDVAGVAVGYGTEDERWLGDVGVDALRRHAADGEFGAGSMGPKVEAVCRFLEGSDGRRAAIGSLDDTAAAVRGHAGTQVRS